MRTDKGMVIVLSGFSGAGKGTIMKHLLKKYPEDYNLSISATTRSRRPQETEGVEYFFKTQEEFDRMVANDELLEHAVFNGCSYGTPRAYVEKLVEEGRDVILEIDVQGALQVRKIFPEALLLFVTPPSAAILRERLVGRGTESATVVAERLAISYRESFLMDKYDYLVINDRIEDSVEQVHRIIQSEHYRTFRNRESIARMQDELKDFAQGEE